MARPPPTCILGQILELTSLGLGFAICKVEITSQACVVFVSLLQALLPALNLGTLCHACKESLCSGPHRHLRITAQPCMVPAGHQGGAYAHAPYCPCSLAELLLAVCAWPTVPSVSEILVPGKVRLSCSMDSLAHETWIIPECLKSIC